MFQPDCNAPIHSRFSFEFLPAIDGLGPRSSGDLIRKK